ncbi:MAG: hypothetical protein EOP84_12805 [Verrucomicrobiaceae bacterium]|nr:MAG: hypothetical protein EOP84_12805 [Verrucomicrobiaceae bacterium]
MKEYTFSRTLTAPLSSGEILAARSGKLVTVGLAVAAIIGAWLAGPDALAQSTSLNSGSLGAAGNATNSPGVVISSPGPSGIATDMAAFYSGGSTIAPVNTTLSFNPALNPAADQPFTIEFWANPTLDITDGSGPAPVFNRVSSGDRSGWVFFQRSATEGWNFVMYSGNGSEIGFHLTGGTYTPGLWTHVVAVWDGTTPSLFVNGVNTNGTVGGSGSYNASTSATFSIGGYDTGANPFTGGVDETAFYQTPLNSTQILAHYNAISNPETYGELVAADGAVEYLRNIPEPTAFMMLGVATCFFAARRRRSA